MITTISIITTTIVIIMPLGSSRFIGGELLGRKDLDPGQELLYGTLWPHVHL